MRKLLIPAIAAIAFSSAVPLVQAAPIGTGAPSVSSGTASHDFTTVAMKKKKKHMKKSSKSMSDDGMSGGGMSGGSGGMSGGNMSSPPTGGGANTGTGKM